MSTETIPGLRVTKLTREKGYWEANVSLNGETVHASCEFGSWQVVSRHGRRFLSPAAAAVLQQKVWRVERRGNRVVA